MSQDGAPEIAYIGLGSNLGDREATLESAVRAIDKLPQTTVLKKSSWLINRAVDIEDGKDFLNGVIEIETCLSPRELLKRLLEFERNHGRERNPSEAGYQNRILDLDILLFGNRRLNEEGLVIPHPRMEQREFVRIPLEELGVTLDSP